MAAWANDLLKQAGQKLSAFDTGHRGNLEAGGARPMPLKARNIRTNFDLQNSSSGEVLLITGLV